MVLTELDALIAAELTASALLLMLQLYSFSVGAVVVVMINVSVLRRVFFRVRMISGYFCHQRTSLAVDINIMLSGLV